MIGVIGQKFKDILGFERSGGGCCQMRFFASENSEILSPYLLAVHISKLHLRIIYVYIYIYIIIITIIIMMI